MSSFKVGLALGGGGVRGLSHLGVLSVFQKYKIPIDIIAGTSMGAIVGGLYALHPDISIVENKIQKALKSRFFDRLGEEIIKKEEGPRIKLFHRFFNYVRQHYIYNLYGMKISLIGEEGLKKVLELIFPNINIEDLKLTFACIAADLCKGDEVIFSKGPIRKAIQASISIPGVFPPVKWNDKLLVDGAVAESVPVEAAFKLGADMVIAVDVRSRLRYITEIDNGLAVIFRSNSVSGIKLADLQLEKADYILNPNVGNISWMNFKKASYCINQGEKEAYLKIKEIIALIKKKRTKTFFKKMF